MKSAPSPRKRTTEESEHGVNREEEVVCALRLRAGHPQANSKASAVYGSPSISGEQKKRTSGSPNVVLLSIALATLARFSLLMHHIDGVRVAARSIERTGGQPPRYRRSIVGIDRKSHHL